MPWHWAATQTSTFIHFFSDLSPPPDKDKEEDYSSFTIRIIIIVAGVIFGIMLVGIACQQCRKNQQDLDLSKCWILRDPGTICMHKIWRVHPWFLCSRDLVRWEKFGWKFAVDASLKNCEHGETIVTGGNYNFYILPGIHTGQSSVGWYTTLNVIPTQ